MIPFYRCFFSKIGREVKKTGGKVSFIPFSTYASTVPTFFFQNRMKNTENWDQNNLYLSVNMIPFYRFFFFKIGRKVKKTGGKVSFIPFSTYASTVPIFTKLCTAHVIKHDTFLSEFKRNRFRKKNVRQGINSFRPLSNAWLPQSRYSLNLSCLNNPSIKKAYTVFQNNPTTNGRSCYVTDRRKCVVRTQDGLSLLKHVKTTENEARNGGYTAGWGNRNVPSSPIIPTLVNRYHTLAKNVSNFKRGNM